MMIVKTIYRPVTICAILLLFIQCKSNKTKTFHFDSVGWTVTVPARMNVRDSATIHKALPNTTSKTSFDYSDKMLLQVLDTGGWRLNGSSLSAGIKPMEKSKDWEETLRLIRSKYSGTYDRDYLPETKVDSVFSKEAIDGNIFDKSSFKFTGPGRTQHIMIYSRAINGYEFHCIIAYPDTGRGKPFMDIFHQSSFR